MTYYAQLEIQPCSANVSDVSAELDKLLNERHLYRQEGWVYSGPTDSFLLPLLQSIKEEILPQIKAVGEWKIRGIALYELKQGPSEFETITVSERN